MKFVTPSADTGMNVLIYGGPKQGKTVGAASAPGPTLYLNADRPNATRMAHKMFPGDLSEVHVEGLNTLAEATVEIEKGEFKTVVLDTVGETYRILLEESSGRAIRPTLQNYGDSGEHLLRFCRAMVNAPVNAVFVCHEITVKNDAEGGFEHLPFTTTQTGSPVFAAKLMAMVDVIAYAGIARGEGDAPDRYVAQLIDGGGRRGGDRFGVLGPNREMILTEWDKLIRESNAPKKAQKEKAA